MKFLTQTGSGQTMRVTILTYSVKQPGSVKLYRRPNFLTLEPDVFIGCDVGDCEKEYLG